MSRRLHTAALGVVALVLLATSTAMAGDARPWTGHSAGQTWFDLENPKACDAGITTRADEPAISSHVGRSFLVMSHCPTGDPADNYHDSDFALHAANGDVLYGTYVGTIDEFSEILGTEFVSTIHLTITGGTGRFEGATGSAVMEVRAIFEGYDDLSWPWRVSWEGELRY
jgi:hypothetical protein